MTQADILTGCMPVFCSLFAGRLCQATINDCTSESCMTHIKRSALLPFPAERLFDLVNRVEHYPEFLPWCSKAEILDESDEQMRARLTVGKAGLNQSFTTRNELVSNST